MHTSTRWPRPWFYLRYKTAPFFYALTIVSSTPWRYATPIPLHAWMSAYTPLGTPRPSTSWIPTGVLENTPRKLIQGKYNLHFPLRHYRSSRMLFELINSLITYPPSNGRCSSYLIIKIQINALYTSTTTYYSPGIPVRTPYMYRGCSSHYAYPAYNSSWKNPVVHNIHPVPATYHQTRSTAHKRCPFTKI